MKYHVKTVALLFIPTFLIFTLNLSIGHADNYGDDGWSLTLNSTKRIYRKYSDYYLTVDPYIVTGSTTTIDENHYDYDNLSYYIKANTRIDYKNDDGYEHYSSGYAEHNYSLNSLDHTRYEYKVQIRRVSDRKDYSTDNPAYWYQEIDILLTRKLKNQTPTITLNQPTSNSPLQALYYSVREVV